MLEKFLKDRGSDFSKYKNTVPSFVPLQKQDWIRFLVVCLATLVLDLSWLGGLMRNFYSTHSASVARLSEAGGFDAILWAAALVYFAIPLGVSFFAIIPGNPARSLFRGMILGLVIYVTYDLTNIALLKSWPLELAIVDVIWGPILCGLAAVAGSAVKENDVE